MLAVVSLVRRYYQEPPKATEEVASMGRLYRQNTRAMYKVGWHTSMKKHLLISLSALYELHTAQVELQWSI
jgi:hypothetical protein